MNEEQEKIIADAGQLFTVTVDDKTYEARSEAWIIETFKDRAPAIIANAKAALVADAGRAAIRDVIEKKVGDTSSILGTTADVTQLNAAAILAFILSLKTSENYEDFQKTFLGTIENLIPPAGDGAPDIYQQAQAFLAAIETGDIILTAALKGAGTVINEMATRSNGVAQILIAAMQKA